MKPTEDGTQETVIVGWYEHALVHRYYQNSFRSPFGLDRDFFVTAKAEDCYLLPEGKRAYTIGRAAVDGKGRGFGQSNVWYADSEYARENIVPEVVAYLEANRAWRINRIDADFMAPADVSVPLTEKENKLADEYYDDSEYMKFLPLGYRAYAKDPTGDNAYFMAAAMKGLHQYDKAIEWFFKVIELEGDSWDVTSNLPYLYMECDRHGEAIETATKLLSFAEANDPAIDSHSFLESFSLNRNADTKAESTITPPETRGNCTEAGTSFAAKRCRKLPVYVAAPIKIIIHNGLILSVSITCLRVSICSRSNVNAKIIKLKIAVSAQEMTVKLISSTDCALVWCALAITPVKPFKKKIARQSAKKTIFLFVDCFCPSFALESDCEIACKIMKHVKRTVPIPCATETGSFKHQTP